MSSHEETVLRLELEVGEALTRGDVAALERYLADDFVGINPAGWEITKADTLAQICSSDYEIESIVNEVQRVRVFGDVAVVVARGIAKGKYRGQRADMTFLYTRIWVHRNGSWQAIAAHASPLPTQFHNT
jgi:ketosteroid isomerase-like protein